MIERSGKVIFGEGARVTGRLWRADREQKDNSDVAKILVWDGISKLRMPPDETAVGIVMLREAEGVPREASEEIPTLCLYDCEEAAEELLSDKIAILDCQRGRLCVDPDVDVIRGYFEGISVGAAKKLLWICTDGTVTVDGSDGVRIKVVGDEDEAYELLCDVADKNTGARIIAEIEYGEGALECIKGIYRAAVWGRISLLCRVRTPEEAENFFSLTHSAFCTLEKQGREFNGFISKGLAVYTPIMLLTEPSRFADFFVIDCNSLLERFGAGYTSRSSVSVVFDCILNYIERREDIKISLECYGETARRAAEYFGSAQRLTEIYSDKDTWRELRAIT